MTTDHGLREPLEDAAGGPNPLPRWDDVARRSRHHRRVDRARRGALGVLAVVVAVGAIALVTTEQDHDRDDVVVDEPTTVGPGYRFPSSIIGARADGPYLVLTTSPIDGTNGEPYCDDYALMISETPDAVRLDAVPAGDPDAQPWTDCRKENDEAGLKATVELDDPLGGRRVLFGPSQEEVDLREVDPGLLSPSWVPPPFDIADRTPVVGGFIFRADGFVLLVSKIDSVSLAHCHYGNRSLGVEQVPVASAANAQGNLCSPSDGTYQLDFTPQGSQSYMVRLGYDACCLAFEPAPFTPQDIQAIVDSLEPANR